MHKRFTTACLLSVLTILMAANAPMLNAQEIRAHVDLNTRQISSSDFDYLPQLKSMIEEYINDRRWTDDTFLEEERIEVRLTIDLLSADANANFEANLVIQAFRPIYNTLNKTLLVLINDNTWRFNFTRGRNILFDLQQYDDIASIIDFYMYLILGYDYDSFSELGGTRYFQLAQNVVNVAQSGGGGTGWSATGSRRSKHQLVTQLNNPAYENIRKAFYIYHRHGLDLFTINTERARQNVLQAYQLLLDAKRQTTEQYLFDILFQTKYREFTSIFVDAELNKRLEAYNLLIDLDSGRISEYDKLQ